MPWALLPAGVFRCHWFEYAVFHWSCRSVMGVNVKLPADSRTSSGASCGMMPVLVLELPETKYWSALAAAPHRRR